MLDWEDNAESPPDAPDAPDASAAPPSAPRPRGRPKTGVTPKVRSQRKQKLKKPPVGQYPPIAVSVEPKKRGRLKIWSAESIIKALRQNDGIVARAAQALGCSYASIYLRLKQEPEIRAALDEIREQIMDVAETKLIELIHEKQLGAICFYLKCHGKHRGWIERIEAAHSGSVNHEHSGTIRLDLRAVVAEFESVFGSDLESIARARFGLAVPSVRGPDADDGSAGGFAGILDAPGTVPDAAPRGPHGSNGHGPDPQRNGNGHAGH